MARFVYQDESRRAWHSPEQPAATEVLHRILIVGCLQRIAAATELMAENHALLLRERDEARAQAANYLRSRIQEQHRSAALLGIVRKLKGK